MSTYSHIILVNSYDYLRSILFLFQAVPPIGDDEDGHLAYKLGDVIEHENHRCKTCHKYEIRTIAHRDKL